MPVQNPPSSFAVTLFPSFQALDVFGPLDALNNLSLTHPLSLSLLSTSLDPVTTQIPPSNPRNTAGSSSFAQSVVPTHTFATAPESIEVLIVPGGAGARAPDEDVGELVEFIRERFPKLRWLFTICTGSGLAARAGVLDGVKATTNKRAWKEITAWRPEVKWDVTKRWCVGGEERKVWTTSGVSAGMDGMFAWIGEVFGDEVSGRLAEFSEFEPEKDAGNERFARLYGLV